ncbi:hypothetical protein AMTR_s00052p00169910 [Amborella trichopoda]|uniref:Methyltransferase domain-containing protein n=1 Tax=Amborella trichopoda TaxID=13333 RepID=U5D2F2_AMBTC|nr:hypothetical protein AMTR_s00052p00169910 [Amborella trichopoda]
MGGFQETCHGQGILTISLKKNSMMHIRVSREHQHTCKSTGLMRWESAHLMSSVISENPKFVAGMRILELGCGSGGICSMVAAKFADLVVATDDDINAVKELSPEGFDAIIGTDVNYVSDAILPLFETVGASISTRVWGPPPAFILCHVFCRVDGVVPLLHGSLKKVAAREMPT